MSDDEQFEDAIDTLSEKFTCQVTSDCQLPSEVADNASSVSDEDHKCDDIEAETCSCPEDTDNDRVTPGDVIDEAVLKEQEACLSEEEKQLRQIEARRLKELGNKDYTEGRFETAIEFYTDALAVCLLCHAIDRAILYANRAAAKVKLDDKEGAIADCSKALEFNPDHMKALLRRAELYERSEKFDEALEDYTKAVEKDPSLHVARAACMRLPDIIKDRNEKMKTEMLGHCKLEAMKSVDQLTQRPSNPGSVSWKVVNMATQIFQSSKLKDLGNMVLRPFGLSTDNFKLQQDPSTGSYSVSFQQKT